MSGTASQIRAEVAAFAAEWDRFSASHSRCLTLTPECEEQSDRLDELVESLERATSLSVSLRGETIPQLDDLWLRIKPSMNDQELEEMAAAAKRPWLLVERRVSELDRERANAIAQLVESWRRELVSHARRIVEPACSALVEAVWRVQRAQPQDQAGAYRRDGVDQLREELLRANGEWGDEWSPRVDVCRLEGFTDGLGEMVVESFKTTRLVANEAIVHSERLRIAVGGEALAEAAAAELRYLESDLAQAIREAEPLAPADRLRALAAAQSRELAQGLDESAEDWRERWVGEVHGLRERGMRADLAEQLLDNIDELTAHARTLVRYEGELRASSAPAGTYAVSEDGEPLTNPPRPRRWIELHPAGWDEPLPPFPRNLAKFRASVTGAGEPGS